MILKFVECSQAFQKHLINLGKKVQYSTFGNNINDVCNGRKSNPNVFAGGASYFLSSKTLTYHKASYMKIWL